MTVALTMSFKLVSF